MNNVNVQVNVLLCELCVVCLCVCVMILSAFSGVLILLWFLDRDSESLDWTQDATFDSNQLIKVKHW